MMQGNGQLSVPPGFRFHPTDEELLYYYLRKKVTYEPIDLDVIRDVDLNKLEPWDLKDKCRVGSGQQNEWYFFSHKDKKYPTGTRTNRATTAGFWKATGRDKAIHISSSKRIGMRKTLVFYIGRAPNGQKTDWIMHEYRLNEEDSDQFQDEGWVVCRVFKKKNHVREHLHSVDGVGEDQPNHMKPALPFPLDTNQGFHLPWDYSVDNTMHLPQLLSAESGAFTSFNPPNTGGGSSGGGGAMLPQHNERFNGDWSILDKLLASHQSLDHLLHGRSLLQSHQLINANGGGLGHKFPLQNLGCDGDLLKFPK